MTNKTFVVRYETKDADAANANQRLVEAVFAELNADDPGGLRYATFRLADGVTFVHVAVHETEKNVLEDSAAFRDFQKTIAERVAGPPSFSEATLVGSYRFLTPGA
ncbi:hypothetical protein [Kribbella deserti]|uniref:Antibiotic biosynthesis monooxygenase n=1 Tax=Kribbella deserti TaxID=1926257 RepID=A0ABV6QRS2_9ACTN